MAWTKIYSKTFSGLNRESIWRIWSDVNKWPSWHGDLDYCRMDGPFKVGNHFILKPKGVGPVKIVLTDVNEGYSFTDCTQFFGARMIDTHMLEETSLGLKLTNTLVVTGPLSWFWIKCVAQNVADTIPDEMEALVRLANEAYA